MDPSHPTQPPTAPRAVVVRCEAAADEARALAEAWPEVPEAGDVALVAMPVGPQGEVDAHAVPLSLLMAAARRLASGGARVRVVAVPTTLDVREPFDEAVAAMRAAGLEVCTEDSPTEVPIGGQRLARAALLEPVAAAQHRVVMASVAPHHHLGLSGPLLAAAGMLSVAAREGLFRAASQPEVLREALGELAAALGPVRALAYLGPDLGALVGGELADVEAIARRCHGLESPPVQSEGVDPALVFRAAASAREALPAPPERYPGVDAGLCTRCEICTSLCPTGAIALPGGRSGTEPLTFELSACVRCGICAAACPDFAIAPTVRPMAARLGAVAGLVLTGDPRPPRPAAVPVEAALALGPDAIDPPARRPAWLERYEPPDRFERARARERHPEPRAPRSQLAPDGAVRLIIPPNWGIRENHTSLGVAYLAASLDQAGLGCHVVDLARDTRIWDPALTEQLAVVGDPDPNGGVYGPRVPLLLQVVDPEAWGAEAPLLARQVHESAVRAAGRIGDPSALHGLTVADSSVTYAFALGAALRRMGCRVVLGGPTMSHLPTTELALRLGVADAVVEGEGEAAMVALARAHDADAWDGLAREGIPGLNLLEGEALRRFPNARNRALDELPHPVWRGQLLPAEFAPILAARGCVTRCSFCSEQTISPKFAQRSVADVLAEMDAMHARHGTTRFEFNDDLLNGHLRWLEELCEALIARGAPYAWQGLFRPHRLDRRLLALMRAAGCDQVTYGVQHFSWRMLQIMGRKEEPDSLRRVLDDTLELGFECFIDIIVGHPGETEEDFRIAQDQVRSLMARYGNLRINQNPFNYIYGSAVDLDPARFGVEVTRHDGALPESQAALAPVVRRFVTAFTQSPGAQEVVERVNRLAWSVFAARRPPKIPILDEELPFCNDNCLHCGVADIMKTANVVPTQRVIRALHELVPRSGGRVMFAVSELTIRPDFLEIVRAARRAGMRTIALVTNGRMFVYPEFTRRTVKAGLTHALVSVYGPTARVHQSITRTPESFQQTLGGLENLLACPQVTVMTNSVITKKNYRYLPQMVELLCGLGVRNINLSFVQIIGAAARYQQALVPRIREVLPALREAVDLGVAMGARMGIGGLPYCVLKGYEHHFGVDDLTEIANGDASDTITERSPYAKAKACERCAMNAVCLGMQEEYLSQFGEDELEPYHGRRLERRPDSEIVRAMFPDMQWSPEGLPSSLLAVRRPVALEGAGAARAGGA
ncbi:MAG: radical SAM protein [Deltaproteobacteria bacterium]|nr:radical SAM protein [Deltaproteobacteria bacterium]